MPQQPEQPVYHFAAIGIGPFNLGLAALSHNLKNCKGIFLDAKDCFGWHPGLLLQHAVLQVPFYADLVTLADPCNPFSYLNFLKTNNRLFKFAIKDDNYVYRLEYNEYCTWVACQLNSLRFKSYVHSIEFDEAQNYFIIETNSYTYKARKLVLGVGTEPYIPLPSPPYNRKNIFHAAEFLQRKEGCLKTNAVAIIGSGQSAAEIFYDLLQNWHNAGKQLSWFTRSERIFPMDTSPFCCELSTPDYIDHFFRLSSSKKTTVLKNQACLYKGISHSLLKQIYDLLYLKMVHKEDNSVKIQSNCSVQDINGNAKKLYSVLLRNEETGIDFTYDAGSVIFATGYAYRVPACIDPVKHMINFAEDGGFNTAANYSVDKDGCRIFVQNAEMQTHGFNAPDLSLGPYRNGIILNNITGVKHFNFGQRNVFQQW